LRKKEPRPAPPAAADEVADHLPYGAYAVISESLTDAQRALVDEALDKLKEAGATVCDRRDVELRRYEKALTRWHERTLDRVRARIGKLIAGKKRAAKAGGRTFELIDDELRVSSASTEADLRAALSLLDYDPAAQAQLFEEAGHAEPMPDPPKSLRDSNGGELDMPDLKRPVRRADFSGFK
jgi:Asp-tRNA(Asn)/Glu-tRNA(Gln) amidotransferase A subunit family amidase